MFVLDSLLIGGLRFVLQKVADVADQQLNDPERWRTALLELQLDLENGRIPEDEFAHRERDILARLRELNPDSATSILAGADDVASIEVEAHFDDESER